MASSTLRFLTTNQVKRIYVRMIIAGAPTQPHLLESAVASPVNIAHYTGEGNVFRLAAALSGKVTLNHAFQDGNKRTALCAADVFMRVNGYRLQDRPASGQESDLAEAQVRTATSELSEEDLAKQYETMATRVATA